MPNNIEKEVEKRVLPADFPDSFRRIVDSIGVIAALELAKTNGGINQYIPIYDSVTQAARDRLIKEEFDGNNYRDLALKYRISEVWVRTVIDKERREQFKKEMTKNQTILDL